MQVAPLIGGADQKDAHIPAPGGLQGRLIFLANEIPMQIQKIKSVAFHRRHNQVCGGMGGKAQMTNATISSPTLKYFDTAPRPQGLLQMFRQI